MDVDAVVQRPHRLEIVLHPLLQFPGYLVQREEVLQVPPLDLVEGSARVHPLDDGSDVTEHHSVH